MYERPYARVGMYACKARDLSLHGEVDGSGAGVCGVVFDCVNIELEEVVVA